jgi:hypothetical protein
MGRGGSMATLLVIYAIIGLVWLGWALMRRRGKP